MFYRTKQFRLQERKLKEKFISGNTIHSNFHFFTDLFSASGKLKQWRNEIEQHQNNIENILKINNKEQ